MARKRNNQGKFAPDPDNPAVYHTKEYRQQYYENNKDNIIKRSKEWYEENKDEILTKRQQKYQDTISDKDKSKIFKEQQRKYYKKNKEKIAERNKIYKENNKEHLKERDRNSHLKRTYGISLIEYNELLEKQNNSCAVCYRNKNEFGRNLAVDHNHKTGEVRGLLCAHCNQKIIGRETDPQIFHNAASYLETATTGWFVPKKRRRRKRKH